jgi:aminoglycoside phosphotransferase (APT) family kinase protein
LAHDDVIGAAAAAGDALRRWQQLDPPGVLAHHDAGDEIAVLERWVGDAAARGLFDERDRGRLRACVDEAVRALGALPRRPPVLAHRDLHDRQLLVDSDGRVGFLDLDTVALADPALDVGNLIAHIELAAAGGVIEASTMRPTIAALLEGFLGAADATVDATAVGAYRLASRTRLVAVHAFRPTTRRAAAALLHGPASAVRS